MDAKQGAMEGLEIMLRSIFWKNKHVFVTGHTGFKGSWLCLWLTMLGAKVTGYALKPPTKPNLFELCRIDELVTSIIADVRDLKSLKKAINKARPDIAIHMAAQPLVRESYCKPADTYEINVMGTVNFLEAVRGCRSVKAVVNVTTDKCYKNKETLKGYKEDEPLGGSDPYSSSKACSELVTSAYSISFLHNGIVVATARAGNAVGGGDWGVDRLVPDFIRAILKGKNILIRNPKAIRPWQHVLEPLCGYLMLSEKLYVHGSKYAQSWNFGPDPGDAKTVEWVIKKLISKWDSKASFRTIYKKQPHETGLLCLDASKAKSKLGWKPVWNIETALDKVIEWTKAYKKHKDLQKVCFDQINEYMEAL